VFIRPYENKDFQPLLLLDRIVTPAIGAQVRPDRADEFKKMLIDRVAEDVPRAQAALDNIERVLKG